MAGQDDKRPKRTEQGKSREDGGRASAARARPRGGREAPAAGRGKKRVDRPRVRSGGVKVSMSVARLLRGGHPWLFRDAMGRASGSFEFGATVPVADEEGYMIGYGLFDPEGPVAVRMMGMGEPRPFDEAEMKRRLEVARDHRGAFLEDELVTAHRVVHGEADGFPGLAIDTLGEYLLVYKYARVAEAYLDRLIPVLQEVFEPQGVYLQDRTKSVAADERRPPAFLMAGKPAPTEFEVSEDGLKFLVDVTAPVSPGLFLDLREGRRAFEARAKDRDVLNLFSFTGAFSVRAVRAGAASITNVDAAARSHARCRQNLAASGLDPEACEAVTGDVFKHLERFRQRKRDFDLVVVDPPPFSTVRGAVFSALRQWKELMTAVCGVTRPGGLVFAVCNAAKLDDAEFLLALGEGAEEANRRVRVVGELGLPPDFPVPPAFIEGRYLRVKLLAVS